MKISSLIIALVTGILIFVVTFYFANTSFLSSLCSGLIGIIGVTLVGIMLGIKISIRPLIFSGKIYVH